LKERNHHRPLRRTGNEVGGPVERIDQPDSVPLHGCLEAGVPEKLLLAHDQCVRDQVAQSGLQQPFRLFVGDGHDLSGRLVANVAPAEALEPRFDDFGGDLAQ
jgi:hypothetical protein